MSISSFITLSSSKKEKTKNMTEENSYFFILANYLNKRLCRRFQMSAPFLVWRGRSLNFSAVKRGVHLGWGAVLDNHGISSQIYRRIPTFSFLSNLYRLHCIYARPWIGNCTLECRLVLASIKVNHSLAQDLRAF